MTHRPGEDPRTSELKQWGLTGLLVGVTVIWGWTFVIVHDAVRSYCTMGFLAIRFTLAAALLAPLAARKLTRRTVTWGTGIGLALGLGYLTQTLGLEYTTPTNSGLITGLFIVFVPIFDRMLYGLRARWMFLAAIAASMAGTVLLIGVAWPTGGDLLTMVCAAAFGLHVSLLSRHAPEHSALALAFVQMATMAVCFWVGWLLWATAGGGAFSAPGAEVWWALAVTAVLASALAFLIQTFVQSRIPAVRTAVILSTEPMFAALFGNLLAGDVLSAIQWCGAGLIVSAIFLAEVFPAWQRARAAARARIP